MEQKQRIVITPRTKVLELIESYPELEDLLIEIAPAFKKLKNPVLRKTVAKIATLQQAAAIGNVSTEELINRLRKAAGQDAVEAESEGHYNYIQPGWFTNDKIKVRFDVSEMLAAGEHPVNQVVADLKALNSGEIYELKAPFLTAPLIDKATSLGFAHWVVKKKDEDFRIFFTKR